MPGLLQDLAEATLSEATLVLFQVFGADYFPEFYVQDLARTPMVERLHRRRKGGRRQDSFDRERPAFEALPPSPRAESAYYRRQMIRVESLIEEAVDILFDVGEEYASRYVELPAQEHMARCLRRLREQQSPSERAAFVAESNRLRALVGQPPETWENLVTVVLNGARLV